MKESKSYPIVLLHGIHRTANSMRSFQRAFDQRGFLVINLSYPSMKHSIEESANSIAVRLAPLGEQEFDMVVHSLGGLVTRAMLARHPRLRVRRLVMLGTPNRGSELATKLQKSPIYRVLFGKPHSAIAHESEFIKNLPPPRCEFGIIAGGFGKKFGMVPWVRGDNDGLVAVESAKLDGAKDFILLRLDHRRLLHSRKAIHQTLHFLEHGRFEK